MTGATTHQQTYRCFADLLDYPRPDIPARARTCADLLYLEYPEAADQIQGFVEYVENTPLGRLEEIYTGTFDVNPACYIFAGYLLFGESFNRGKFLVRLQEEYRKRGFSAGNELADHLAVMFRFSSTLDPNELLAQQLLRDCFVPVLTKMNASFGRNSSGSENENLNPYRQVLRAILIVLERAVEAEPAI